VHSSHTLSTFAWVKEPTIIRARTADRDVAGNTEGRQGTVSVSNGPEPQLVKCESEADEIERVAMWIKPRPERKK
jgi:hypothetical protein